MTKPKKKGQGTSPAELNLLMGWLALWGHPMFTPLLIRTDDFPTSEGFCLPSGWAVVSGNGVILTRKERLAEPEEWIYVLAHCLLHLGLGHFQERENRLAWNAACDVFITRFLADLKLGKAPEAFQSLPALPAQPEEKLYQRFCEDGIPAELRDLGTAGPGMADMRMDTERLGRSTPAYLRDRKVDWPALFGRGLARAVQSAVNVAAGVEPVYGDEQSSSVARRARNWFISSYPLLGALAASFDLIEDPELCRRLEISVAAVDAEMREIYINPAAGLSEHEARFVMAHELLHVGLRHQARRQGRDAFLWNVACDYVINGWLVEMGLGDLPQVGALYDPQLKGLSTENIYERIVTDLRTYRKLATLRGKGLGDILERGNPDWWELKDGMDLDDFYRRCLSQGLVYHEGSERGLLPAGLVEEIEALGQPPIPWDVELARWFDHYFPIQEKVRVYARPSRRQSATPEIPRPSYVPPPESDNKRTFGVILDTSGSMDRHLLAAALGTISSYSLSREVPLVRVVFCDAAPYDMGYLTPDDIAGRVQVRGRGGTVLQPGIDLIEKAEDFPKDGPLLIITDGWCDRLVIHHEHAYLIPEGRRLPFVPRGKVFYIS